MGSISVTLEGHLSLGIVSIKLSLTFNQPSSLARFNTNTKEKGRGEKRREEERRGEKGRERKGREGKRRKWEGREGTKRKGTGRER